MFTFLTSTVGLTVAGGYLYVAFLAGRASYKAGNGLFEVVFDAITWPNVVVWKTIKNLYKV